MKTILIPMTEMPKSFSKAKYTYPLPLIEFDSITVIERVVKSLKTLGNDFRFVYVINTEIDSMYCIGHVIERISPDNSVIVKLAHPTQGSICSCLMAIKYLPIDDELIICNYDQIFDIHLAELLPDLRTSDCAVLTIHSVHPRWSYVKINEDNTVNEAAEKDPISSHAIAGFYYYRKGHYFITAAKECIRKKWSTNGKYYVSSTLDELILQGKTVKSIDLDNNVHHTLYSPMHLEDYIQSISNRETYNENY